MKLRIPLLFTVVLGVVCAALATRVASRPTSAGRFGIWLAER